jgi:Peptidase propeptide and YPEB domain
MRTIVITERIITSLRLRIVFFAIPLLALSFAPVSFVQSQQKQVKSSNSTIKVDGENVNAAEKMKNRSERKSKKKNNVRTDIDNEDSEVSARTLASGAKTESITKGLSAQARYISMLEAIKRAKAEGGSGELLKVDLEWDEARSTVTWDLTFSSGIEYEIDAYTGKSLGTKAKGSGKLAMLSPLALNDREFLTVQEIIRKAESARGQGVLELELTRLKGSAETIYELALADGANIYYDAVTGQPAKGK